MKKFKHIIKNAKSVSLSKDERAGMKLSLESHIADNPVVATSGSFILHKRVSSLEWMGAYFSDRKFMVPVMMALSVIVLVGGISFAAESALPGDPLYGVKILNEKIASTLAFSPESKARIESLHAVTRLEEAETLSAEGKLDENKNTEITNSFSKSSTKAVTSISDLKTEDKDSGAKASVAFKGRLTAHQNILVDIDSKNSATGTIHDKLPNAVSTAISLLNDSISTSTEASSSPAKEKVEEDKKQIFEGSKDTKVNDDSSAKQSLPSIQGINVDTHRDQKPISL